METYDALERTFILAHQQMKQLPNGPEKEEALQAIETAVNYYVAQLADYAHPEEHPQSEKDRRLTAVCQALIAKGIPVPEWVRHYVEGTSSAQTCEG